MFFCPPMLPPMEIERVVHANFVESRCEMVRPKSEISAFYEDNRGFVHEEFWSEGQVEMHNLASHQLTLRYVQQVMAPEHYDICIEDANGWCYESDKGRLSFFVSKSIPPGRSYILPWSVRFDLVPRSDLNNDGVVDSADMGLLFAAWSTDSADINRDGVTNGQDLGILLEQWTSN